VFVDAPELFDRGGLYSDGDGVDYPDNAWRFALFDRAALECVRLRGERPSVIHAHDWHTGLVPVYQKMHLSDDPIVGGVPAIFTVHNLAFQGVFPSVIVPEIGLTWDVFNVQAIEYWGQISLLKGGINFSERITTVSPTYSKEILTPDLGFGFDGVLRRRAEDLIGILNGIDVDRWNPATDTLAGATFTAGNLAGKAAAKRGLLADLNLPADGPALARPVIALISRLTAQKGFDLIAAAADGLMSLDATWVMHGSGDADLEEVWRGLALRHPDRVHATIGYDEGLEHRLQAGADLLLMPSRYEPCGLTQMHSLRYGTVPVVHATGGLADTIRDASQPRGNGIKFQDFTPAGLLDALRRALDLFHKPKEWSKIQKAGMKDDHSWDVSAREYVKVYEGAVRAATSRG
jgi:starch synthase